MPSLTRAEAVARAEVIAVESYVVDLDLTTGDEVFGSITTVRFRCERPGESTFVELRPAELRVAMLNGRPVDPAGARSACTAAPRWPGTWPGTPTSCSP